MPSNLSGVKAIYSTDRAFAALKEDGTVEAWGDSRTESQKRLKRSGEIRTRIKKQRTKRHFVDGMKRTEKNTTKESTFIIL